MEEINNILESLRRALQNVDSARVQTERTINAYNDLQETVRTYILSIENSVEALNQMLTVYEHSKTDMENSVYGAVKTILDKSNEVKTDFERSVQSSINTFNRGIEDNLNNLRTSVSELSEENSKLVNLKRDIDSLCQKLYDFKTDIKDVEKKLEKRITDNTSLIGSLSNETKAIGNNVDRSFDEMKAMYSEGTKKLHNMIVINAVLLVIILILIFIK